MQLHHAKTKQENFKSTTFTGIFDKVYIVGKMI